MKRLFNLTKGILLLLTLGIPQIGCTNEPILEFQEASLKASVNEKSHADRSNQFRFNASLKGGNEATPVDTKAVGEAIVTISKDETKIHYKLIVANIENVTASHFHMAPAGTNGGVVAFLFGPNQELGPYNGILAEGVIEAEDVINALAGDLDALIAAIRSGNIYVNVHTLANPGGEIRGQLY